MGLAIDADDGLGVALAQMHPSVVEVDLDAVDGGDAFSLIMLLDRFEDGVDVHARLEFKAVFGNTVLGVGLLKLANGHAALCQQRQEQSHAHKGVAAVVASGINHATVALSTNDGARAAHFGRDIDLTHCCGRVGAAMLLGDIA